MGTHPRQITHTHTHTHVRPWAHSHVHPHAHTCTHTQTQNNDARAHIHKQKRTPTRVYARRPARQESPTHASAQPPLISTRVPVHARAPTHTRVHKHARKHARERTAHAHTLPCSHASARDKRTPTHARSPARTPVRSCVWSCTRTHVPARAFQQRIHTCTYARTRARTHTGEHACSVRRALQTWARPIRVVRNARAAGARGRRCAAATAQQQHVSTASHTHTPTLTHVTAAATHARAQPHSATRTHTHACPHRREYERARRVVVAPASAGMHTYALAPPSEQHATHPLWCSANSITSGVTRRRGCWRHARVRTAACSE